MNKIFWKRSLPVLLAFVMLSGCIPTGGGTEMDTLRAQVSQHDQILSQLNMQLSGVQPAQADTWSQVQSLRQEIASLRGEMDSINMAMGQSGGAAALADLMARHDRALRLIETQLAMDLQLNQPATTAGMQAGATPSYGTQPQQMGTPTQPQTPVVSAPVTAPPTAVGGDTAQALYDAGMNSFNNRRYEQGLKSFSDFTETYSQHALASNAWFWQGECHYQLKNYGAAALAYEKVIAEFPNSNKAPDSYFKQGMAFIQLGRKDAARERLTALVQKYPKSPFATRAQQEMKSNGI